MSSSSTDFDNILCLERKRKFRFSYLKMMKLSCLLTLVLMLQVSRACNGQNDEEQLAAARQQSDEYFSSAYGYTPNNPWDLSYHQPIDRVPGYVGQYEGRTPPNNNPFNKYFAVNNAYEQNNQPEGRLALGGLGANLINTGLFNNRFTPANSWRPFASLANRIPVSVNPDFSSPLANFDACTSPSGDAGICAPGSVCSLFGGRPSGSCILGKVCCINAITTCGGTVTLNNTYWQSPSTAVSVPSTCALTVRMDTKLVEQLARPICQIRLDFVSFTIAPPSAETSVCSDTFMVGGATTVAPVICGENAGQHMYLEVPSSGITPSEVQLMFNFRTGTATRSWNIKIALLPCGASYLAPTECLQYFSASSGRVKSFNWQDAASARQLNDQNYNICFRTELVSGSRANQMCLSVCTVTNGGDAFLITNPPAVKLMGTNFETSTGAGSVNSAATARASLNSAIGTTLKTPDSAVATCLYDFIQIAGARDADGVEADRYCGNALNPSPGSVNVVTFPPIIQNDPENLPFTLFIPGAADSVQICTPIRPFRMTFKTDGAETSIETRNPPGTPAFAVADRANTGFCLDYLEK